ncbi:hypothetical protein HLH17_06800 [Acinetobacter sp. ANC 5380]|uniref:Uncharacterized protein n=1 Tax=Acinetobacter terrae TaxID=2731247 RepID=A0A7Y2RES9_9GAMM|nr:hypothetical protein [Acinetobacter terrae]NNH77382.1 hypothetical protein [Acinetobacter terrae]
MFLKFFSFSLFFYSVSSFVFADLVDLKNTNAPDSLELLSKEVLTANADESNNPYSIVPIDEYKQLNIQPLYRDSIVKLYKDGSIVEEKSFFNDIYMNHFIGSNFIVFLDLNSDDPTEVKWKVLCSVDKITDAKKCSINNSNIFYSKRSDQPSFLMIGGENADLLRPTYLRIDKNKPFKVNNLVFKRPVLDNILKEMTSGKMIYLRYHKKYKEDSYDDEASLKGFSIAYNTLNILYPKLK